ncbi:MAG: RHS repeat-associated core domain-containing protein [Myxococcales bacterium]|nr:RHS repeat-associated core domain-containing protein [Myxococcales bacterium]
MCPSIAVMGGGGGGGGGSGDGSGDGDGSGGPGGDGNGDGASGDGRNGGCSEGDPVCPITGRVVLTLFDFGFGGPLPLRWMRAYSSRTSRQGGELGHGWSHTFGWRIRAKRSEVVVYDDWNRSHTFERPVAGESRTNGAGMMLTATRDSFVCERLEDRLRIELGPLCDDGFHYMTALVDGYGNRIEVQRTGPRLVGLLDSAGRAYRTRLDEAGRITEIFVANDATSSTWMKVVSYAYDAQGDLESACDAEGFTGRYCYDNHLLTQHHAPSGITFFYRYDSATEGARCVETWGEYLGRTDPALLEAPPPAPSEGPDRRRLKGIFHVKLTYDREGNYCEAENALGGVTRYFGDDKGRGVKIVSADGTVISRAFDPLTGGLAEQTNRGGRNRRVELDATGKPAGFSDDSGAQVRRRRHQNGMEQEANSATGAMIERQYDAQGSLLFARHPDDTTDGYRYDTRGLITEHINRAGVTKRYTHDGMGNCVRIDSTGSLAEVMEYDYLGRRIAHVAPSGARTEWRYDRRSEVVYKRLPDGNEVYVERNADRKPTMVKDSGRVSRFTWGGVMWLVSATSPDGATYEYKYDAMGNCVQVTNPRGETFLQEYDAAGRKTSLTTFEGARYGYGHKGPLRMRLETPTGTFSLERDADARVTAMAAPDHDITFEHSPLGVAKMDNGAVLVETSYDPLGRVVREEQGGNHATVSWHGGKIAAMVPGRGAGVAYQYDTTGALRTMTVGKTRVDVELAYAGDRFTYLGDNLVLRQSYNVAGALVRQSLARFDPSRTADECGADSDPNLVFSRKFFYDETSRYPVSEWRHDGTSIEYELDAGKRITSKKVAKNGAVLQRDEIAYDAAGMPLMAGAAYGGGRPTRHANESFEYDAAGRLVARVRDSGTTKYEWNSLDQLVRVVDGDRVVQMKYDAKGRRMAKTVRCAGALLASVTYFWSRNSLAQEVDELTGRVRTYIRHPDRWQPLGHVDSIAGEERAYLYLEGPSGGVERVVDESGGVVWAAELSVFGEASISRAEIDVSLRYANQFYDADVDLTYNRHRWFDARLGLYVTPDPWLLRGTLAPRNYVDNPLVQIDPTGLMPHEFGVGNDSNSTGTGATHMPSPGVPGNPNRPGDVDSMDSGYMTGNGHWSRPDRPPPGTDDEPAGFANCPEGALDRGSGFGSGEDSAQGIVDRAGDTYGCHSCGSRNSGWDTPGEAGGQHWTCDHVPPRSTYKPGTTNHTTSRGDSATSGESTAVRLYPHCRSCASRQGGLMSHMSTGDRATHGSARMTANTS